MMIKEFLQQKKKIVISIAVFVLLCVVLLSRWVLTPLTNHFVEPYHARFEQVKLNWFPLMVQLKGLEAGQGESALRLDQLEAQANWRFLIGDPITLQIRGGELQIGYHGEEQTVAGFTLEEWQGMVEGNPAQQESPEASEENAVGKQPAVEKQPEKAEKDPNQQPVNLVLKQLTFDRIQVNAEQKSWPTVAVKQLDFGPLALRDPKAKSDLSLSIDVAEGTVGVQAQVAPLALQVPQKLQLDLQQLKLSPEWFVLLPAPFATELSARLTLALNEKSADQATVAGNIELQQFRWQDKTNQVQVSKVQLDQIDLAYDLKGELVLPAKIPLKGGLNLLVEKISLSTAEQQQVQLQRLNLDRISYDGVASVKHLILNKLQVADAGNKLLLAKVELDDVAADPALSKVDFKRLRVEKIEANADANQAQIAAVELNNLSADLDKQQVALNQLQLNALNAASESKQARFKQLTAEHIVAKLDGKHAAINRVEVANLALDDGSNQLENELLTVREILFEQALDIESIDLAKVSAKAEGQDYQLQQLLVKQVSFDPTSKPMNAHIAEVLLNDAKAEVQIPEQKKSEQATSVGEELKQNNTEAEPEESTEVGGDNQDKSIQEPLLYLTLDLLQVKQHQILFQDHNLTKPTLSELKMEQFELKNLRWPSAELAEWNLNAWLDGQSQWLFNGTVSTQPMTLAVKGKQKGLNLPAISPYSEHFADVFFYQGVMDNDIELDWQGQHLKGEVGFLMYGLDLKLDGEFSSENTPLQLALSVLRDSQDRIELGITVDKSGDELNVGAGEIIREFIFSASQKGALAYLKYSLQPFGALLTLADIGGELMKGGAMPLEGLVFDNQQAELKPTQLDYANKLLAMLKERRKMKLQTCVQPGTEERELFTTQLKGDEKKVEQAMLELEQGRIRQWRHIFAEGGVARQLMECPEAQQDAPQMTFNLMLVPQ